MAGFEGGMSGGARAARPENQHAERVGPILFFRELREGSLHLAALLVHPSDEAAPLVTVGESTIPSETLHRRGGRSVLRYRFSVPASGGTYRVAGEPFEVAGVPDADLRLAYVSCNGQEHGNRRRHQGERNGMWDRLERQHATDPLHLLLHGGDQLYADEMLEVHPALREWSQRRRADFPDASAVDQAVELLRDYLLASYVDSFQQPAPARLLARVPSLCMWDDHDICDGWGSLPERCLDGEVGKAVFQAAREFFLLFQLGSVEADLPPICLDRSGATLSWLARLPGVVLVAPDLRSERRPDRVLGPAGWEALDNALDVPGAERVFVLSSVPALGPRLSWVEKTLSLLPGTQGYEDDLRDQWQSQSHREEWRRFLRALLSVHERGDSLVTVLSGEIHLAARGTMAATPPVHQLIASGIAHPPPPRLYARALGALARLGESPLAKHPIRLHPLPGQRGVYAAQRNYLMLERRGGRWSAWWELEHDGRTPPLML